MKSASKKPRIMLDTKPLIKLFAEEQGWEAVRDILSLIEAGELEACVSVVTLTEVYYKYSQEGRQDLAQTRTEQIRCASHLKKCPIDEETAIKAGQFKGKYGIPIADAFIAATAHSEGATIISDDPDFRKVSEVKVLTETEFHHELKE